MHPGAVGGISPKSHHNIAATGGIPAAKRRTEFDHRHG
jgi:hypothetical protein